MVDVGALQTQVACSSPSGLFVVLGFADAALAARVGGVFTAAVLPALGLTCSLGVGLLAPGPKVMFVAVTENPFVRALRTFKEGRGKETFQNFAVSFASDPERRRAASLFQSLLYSWEHVVRIEHAYEDVKKLGM